MKTPKLKLVSACLSTLLLSAAATASPVAYIAKSQLKRFSHSTHVVIMKKAQTSVVTLMPDYEGALDPFAVVTVVPPDVTP
ncbi:MAG TPA: hypothetical protein VGJ84_06795, partial [Polyangiaceae bacterium]